MFWNIPCLPICVSILSSFYQRILCLKIVEMAQWFWRRNKQDTQGNNRPPEQQLHIILLKKLKFPSLEDGFLMEAWLSTICLLYIRQLYWSKFLTPHLNFSIIWELYYNFLSMDLNFACILKCRTVHAQINLIQFLINPM